MFDAIEVKTVHFTSDLKGLDNVLTSGHLENKGQGVIGPRHEYEADSRWKRLNTLSICRWALSVSRICCAQWCSGQTRDRPCVDDWWHRLSALPGMIQLSLILLPNHKGILLQWLHCFQFQRCFRQLWTKVYSFQAQTYLQANQLEEKQVIESAFMLCYSNDKKYKAKTEATPLFHFLPAVIFHTSTFGFWLCFTTSILSKQTFGITKYVSKQRDWVMN